MTSQLFWRTPLWSSLWSIADMKTRQIIATSHDLTQKVAKEGKSPYQENPGWWNIIEPTSKKTFWPLVLLEKVAKSQIASRNVDRWDERHECARGLHPGWLSTPEISRRFDPQNISTVTRNCFGPSLQNWIPTDGQSWQRHVTRECGRAIRREDQQEVVRRALGDQTPTDISVRRYLC